MCAGAALRVTSRGCSSWQLEFSSRKVCHTDKKKHLPGAWDGLVFNFVLWKHLLWAGVDSLQLACVTQRSSSNAYRKAPWRNKNLLQRKGGFLQPRERPRKELIIEGYGSSGIYFFCFVIPNPSRSSLLYSVPTVRSRYSFQKIHQKVLIDFINSFTANMR